VQRRGQRSTSTATATRRPEKKKKQKKRKRRPNALAVLLDFLEALPRAGDDGKLERRRIGAEPNEIDGTVEHAAIRRDEDDLASDGVHVADDGVDRRVLVAVVVVKDDWLAHPLSDETASFLLLL
jgi:hypothetical protein